MPAVSSAIRVISEAVACLDVAVKRIEADGTGMTAGAHPIIPLLRDAANDWTSGYEMQRDLVIDALSADVGGLAYVNRLSDGRPAEIIRYRRTSVGVEFNQSTEEPSYENRQPAPAVRQRDPPPQPLRPGAPDAGARSHRDRAGARPAWGSSSGRS